METNPYSCTRTGCTISQKTMDDGNNVDTRDDNTDSNSLASVYCERPTKITSNGHEFAGETSNLSEELYNQRRPSGENSHEDKFKKRINPLRIHLGKRPFVDGSLQQYNTNKRRKISLSKSNETSAIQRNSVPRAPKLIPKRVNRNQFHNVASELDNERDKPVPRLVPKSQLMQYKKSKPEKGSQLKDYVQSLGLQPMVKFKCRKCCSMSFKTLAMLKEHQLVCRAQSKEPALSPEAAQCTEPTAGGPSRVTRKVYLCSACGTYYENWNLFLHMREVHNRHICLFCLGMFSKAEKLSSHLTNKHNVQEFNYESKEEFFSVYNGTLYLMCCVCDEICSEKDDFFNHDCNNVKPKPVPKPVLISKNAVKPNNIKNNRNSIDMSTNGPVNIVKECKPVSDKESELKLDVNITQINKLFSSSNNYKPVNIDSTISSECSSTTNRDTSTSNTTSKDTSSSVESALEIDNVNTKLSPIPHQMPPSPEINKDLPNGDDNVEHSDGIDSPDCQTLPAAVSPVNEAPIKKIEETVVPVIEKEKECGIKLKLSLNNAKSPVIINSTVDPSIGQQKAHKPPSRNRRPPKRYEKHLPAIPPKTPTIKMTICDKADSPFVKTTIYENDQETTVKTLLNNNLETTDTLEQNKTSDNTIKTTIYDNNLDDTNTFNRVPKLTVRVPKELLDKDSSSDYSSDSDISDKLTVDENKVTAEENAVKENSLSEIDVEKVEEKTDYDESVSTATPVEEKVQINEVKDEEVPDKSEPMDEVKDENAIAEIKKEETPIKSEDEVPVIELTLDRPLDKYPLKELLKLFLSTTVFNCIYCNYVRKVAVNCEQLALHMVAQHRFSATVDSITAEELMPETIAVKVNTRAEELRSVYINLDCYDSEEKCANVQYDHTFECFQCYFKTAVHKDLYLHNRKMHQKTILLCVMCKSNFYSYSELLCHLCPGTYDSEYEIKYRCCLCNVDSIPSSFRLMVHLRKIHHTCDVCLEFCHNQARLSNHVWKHKLHHLCYRCGIAYRNKPDITKHLFWKHGTESVMCKKCLQKKWPHVYHFCIPPTSFVCDECALQFTKAVYLKVHKRFHSNEFPHVCTEEGCTEKFVSKKLLMKHIEEHLKKQASEDLNMDTSTAAADILNAPKELIPVVDLVDAVPKEEAEATEDAKVEPVPIQQSKKSKKKKFKEKDALLLDVDLPALNLSESDSSDESDSGIPPPPAVAGTEDIVKEESKPNVDVQSTNAVNMPLLQPHENVENTEEEKQSEQQVLDIWDNFKKYQAKVEKQKEKTPPLVPIRKHVCESDHDYCIIPTDMNGDEDTFSLDKKKSKKSPKKKHGQLSSSTSSSDTDSDSSASSSCTTDCSSCSSSGSSSSSSSESDSSNESSNEKKKKKQLKKLQPSRRLSNGSNVDVMGMSETPILIPEKTEPLIAETDLETEESETDEEFYDERPQHVANKQLAEKRNQLMLLASAAPSDGGSLSADPSRCTTPIKQENEIKHEIENIKEKPPSSKKKSKKKKKSRSSKKHGPIKINIPKEVIAKSDVQETNVPPGTLVPNKITISLQSNTVQIPEAPKQTTVSNNKNTPASAENKRSSKRRRVPNKFYGYSSDEESTPQPVLALKPQQPPKLEWRKEDLPSPVTHRAKKEVPSSTLTQRLSNYEYEHPPVPEPELPRVLMKMDSSDSESSEEEGALEIYQPNSVQNPAPLPPPSYLNSGTSSLPYPFQRPAFRQAREGESVYCYCRCPYDEVSEMIACDAEGCPIEWFHFECVGIMVPPKGKWYCPECRKNQTFSGYR